ncbi:MAG: ACT domain-containing protein, partial [Desulfurococcaceae archaeon]
LRVLANSRVEVKTGVVIVIMGVNRFLSAISVIAKISNRARFFAVMQSGLAATIVLDENSAEEFLSLTGEEGIIEIQRDQAAIVVVSPVDIMWVPGVIAYITSVLAQNDINIVHVESCYTDTVIVISKKDLLRAFNILMKHIEIARSLVGESTSGFER